MLKTEFTHRFLLVVAIALVVVTGCSEISSAIQAQAALDRGFDYAIEGDLDSAFLEFEKAIELNPDFAAAYDARGTVHLERGLLDLAIADYDRAIELDPNISIFFGDRGLAYMRNGDFDRAIRDLEKVLEMEDDVRITAYAYRNLGEIYAVSERNDLAIENFQEALRISEDPILTKDVSEFLDLLGASN